MPTKVLIRCDAAPAIGFGHVFRCLALADELRDSHGCQVDFAMLQGPQGVAQVQAQSYEVFQPDHGIESADEGKWLQEIIIEHQHQVLILDVRTDLTTEAVQSIHETGVVIATIDDPSDRRLNADLAFYPPVPQAKRLDWAGFTGKRFVGWDWVLLRPQFAEMAKTARTPVAKLEANLLSNDPRRTIAVTMGGSDPAGLTLIALEAIEKLDGDFRVLVVIGGSFMHDAELTDWLHTAKHTYEIHRNVTEMAAMVSQSDLAIISFGQTAYELAVLGVPALYMCVSDDHAESARAFEEAELGLIAGICHEPTVLKWVLNVDGILRDENQIQEMKLRIKNRISGEGSINVAEQIMQATTN